ncbi:hypothetical protein D7Y06_13305 [Roseburia sp. 1XD42-69]|nr:hypothetical protein D7Y06_13305 [Roseburia sp. 1XD42-69]
MNLFWNILKFLTEYQIYDTNYFFCPLRFYVMILIFFSCILFLKCKDSYMMLSYIDEGRFPYAKNKLY